jgi:hypothetical protein
MLVGYRTRLSCLSVAILVFASCGGAPSTAARPSAPPHSVRETGRSVPTVAVEPTTSANPVDVGPVGAVASVVRYGCSVDARHFGGNFTSETWVVDLAAAQSRFSKINLARDEPETQPVTSPPQALDADARSRFDRLVPAVVARNDWQSDPGIMDGMACSLDISGNEKPIIHVQRQQTTRGDSVDRLIDALRALPR